MNKILIVGSPNVGKSTIFNILTGNYANVSNYPGTTVEIFKGHILIDNKKYEIIDTPGLYSLFCITEEEVITKNCIIKEKPILILHIIDAKNIERMLSLTFQLLETDIPVILIINMIDEAIKLNIHIDIKKLENILGIPVIKNNKNIKTELFKIIKEKINEF